MQAQKLRAQKKKKRKTKEKKKKEPRLWNVPYPSLGHPCQFLEYPEGGGGRGQGGPNSISGQNVMVAHI